MLNCTSQNSVSTGSEGNPDLFNFIDVYIFVQTHSSCPLLLIPCKFQSFWYVIEELLKSLYMYIVTLLPMDRGNLAITKEGTSVYTTWCYIQNHLCLDFGLERMVALIILTAESLVIICNLELTLHLPHVLQCTKHLHSLPYEILMRSVFLLHAFPA